MRKLAYLLSLTLLGGCQSPISLQHDLTQKERLERLSRHYVEKAHEKQEASPIAYSYTEDNQGAIQSLIETEKSIFDLGESCKPNELSLRDYDPSVSKSRVAIAGLDELVLKPIEQDPSHLLYKAVTSGKKIFYNFRNIFRFRIGNFKTSAQIGVDRIGIGFKSINDGPPPHSSRIGPLGKAYRHIINP